MSAQVRSLFPAYHNPFYAGFGNRDSDTRTYVSLKVSTHPYSRGCSFVRAASFRGTRDAVVRRGGGRCRRGGSSS